jgi:hypothetical protein
MRLKLLAIEPTEQHVVKHPEQQRPARTLEDAAIPFLLRYRCRLLARVRISRKLVRTKASSEMAPSRIRARRPEPSIHQHAGCIRDRCRHETNPIMPDQINQGLSAWTRFSSMLPRCSFKAGTTVAEAGGWWQSPRAYSESPSKDQYNVADHQGPWSVISYAMLRSNFGRFAAPLRRGLASEKCWQVQELSIRP